MNGHVCFDKKYQPPLVSIVIASYNAAKHIRACLDSLLAQSGTQTFEIIVADSSQDGTDCIVEKEYPMVRLIRMGERTLAGSARNIAIREAKGGILACIDTDCIAGRNWIANIVNAHQHGNNRVVGGAIINGTPTSFVGTAEYFLEFSEYCPDRRDSPSRIRMVPGCNLSLSHSLFKRSGGFDSHGMLVAAEDLLFCNRMRQNGTDIIFDPAIRVQHKNRTEIGSMLRHKFFLGFGSAIARRMVAVKGSFFAKYPVLVPLLPFARIVILLKRG